MEEEHTLDIGSIGVTNTRFDVPVAREPAYNSHLVWRENGLIYIA